MLPRLSRFSLDLSQWMILATIVLLVLLSVGYVERFTQNMSAQAELKQWEQRVEEMRQRQSLLKDQLAYVQTDDYVEQQAREALGWVKPGDIQVEVIPEEAPQEAQRQESQRLQAEPPWREWWDLFFGP